MSKKKVVLSIFAATLLLTGAVLYYLLAVKEYAIDDERVIDLVENEYTVTLPGEFEEPLEEEEDNTDTSVSSATEETDKENTETEASSQESTGTSTSASSTAESDKKAVAQTKTGTASQSKKSEGSTSKEKDKNGESASEAKKVSANVIIEHYVPSFAELESQANERINALVEYAQNDYITKKQSDQEVSYISFYTKYSTAGRTIEKNTDAAFDVIYQALVQTLKEYGHDESKAKPIKDHYEQSKKERRNSLIDKAKTYL